jgi:uncharacterized protein YjdB
VQFTATGTYTDKSTQNITSQVTWASATPSVATISNNAGSQGLATGVAAGTSTISAKLNGITETTVLSVANIVLQSIAVTPANPSVAAGTTTQFTATGTFSDNSTQTLTDEVVWASAAPSIATISNASGSNGLATGVKAGPASISATFEGVTGSTVLTVSAAVLQSIAVTPADPSIPNGTTEQFTATGTFSDHSTQDLTKQVVWASAAPGVATISNASGSNGLATSVATGSSSISAALDGVTGSTTLTVVAAALQSISVTPANPSIPDGSTDQFTATGTYSDHSTQDLTTKATWASGQTTVATIDAAGLATGVGMGSSTITAMFDGVSGSTSLTVAAPALQSIAITPANPSVAKGLTEQFTATGTYTDKSTQDVTADVSWVSATQSVATVTSAGLASAVATGDSTISATLDGVTGSTTLTVIAAALKSIAVTPTAPNLPDGLTQQFQATGTYTDNSTQNLTSEATWASATMSVATIDTNGLATGIAEGSSIISAMFDGISGATRLTVTAPVLVSIAVTPGNPMVPKGETEQFVATGTYSDTSTQNITSQVVWASASTSVATITSAGIATGAETGSSTISATDGSITGTTILDVSPAVLESITISPDNPEVAAGITVQFKATGTYSDSSTQDLTAQSFWASDTPSVATVSNTAGSQGLTTTKAMGMAMITAAVGNVTGMAMLMVDPAALVSIAVTTADLSLAKGLSEQFTATGTYTDNSTAVITSNVTWSSASTSVATVSASGLAKGVSTGTSGITASLAGITGTKVLTVLPPILESIAVTPGTFSLTKGKTEQFAATGTYSDGSTQNLTNEVIWASAAKSVATISNSGLATWVSAGTTQITATEGSVSSAAKLTTLAPPLVTISSVRLVTNKGHMVTQILVTFSGAVNASEADRTGEYRLASAGKNGSFTAKNATIIKLRSAVYSSTAHAVTLTPKAPFALSKPVQLVIDGNPPAGLQDAFGRLIDGDRNGHAGGNDVVIFKPT